MSGEPQLRRRFLLVGPVGPELFCALVAACGLWVAACAAECGAQLHVAGGAMLDVASLLWVKLKHEWRTTASEQPADVSQKHARSETFLEPTPVRPQSTTGASDPAVAVAPCPVRRHWRGFASLARAPAAVGADCTAADASEASLSRTLEIMAEIHRVLCRAHVHLPSPSRCPCRSRRNSD